LHLFALFLHHYTAGCIGPGSSFIPSVSRPNVCAPLVSPAGEAQLDESLLLFLILHVPSLSFVPGAIDAPAADNKTRAVAVDFSITRFGEWGRGDRPGKRITPRQPAYKRTIAQQ
jgi:hypothetical protein